MDSILILSFWNPSKQSPNRGIFIHEQVDAICKNYSGIVFLEVNILPSKSKLFQKEIVNGSLYANTLISITIYSFLWKALYINPWFTFILLKKYLRTNYNDLKLSLIHSNVIFPCGIVGHLLARHYRSKHIISEHWSKAENLLKHAVYGKIALKAYKKSKAIICVSSFLANKIKSATGHSNMIIIPNIIDTNLFHHIPKITKPEEIRFSCCATWKAPKRLDLIINGLLKFASETNQRLILNVIGNGIQKEAFLHINLPENVAINWLGYIPKAEIARILNQTDVFLHASEIETFSIVVAEALSTGTPVLASNKGALPELINASNGILVENTLEAWIKGIRQIIKISYNHLTISQNVFSKFSPESVAQSIEKVYDDVLNNP